MKIKRAIPVLLAVSLICAGQINSANAYFTTYVEAKGGQPVTWEHEEKMKEDFHDWNKLVQISSMPSTPDEPKVPVFVRVKGYSGSTYQLVYTGNDWTYNAADGFYYYKTDLLPGETTTGLNIEIKNIPGASSAGDNFNVVVIFESIVAEYNADGSPIDPLKADWTNLIGTGTADAGSAVDAGGAING